MYKPVTGGAEWVEIFNTSGFLIELSGWSFSDADSADRLEISTGLIYPGSYSILARDSTIYDWDIPPDIPVIIPARWKALNNDGDDIYLFDAAGAVADEIHYPNNWGGVDNGLSMERTILQPGKGDWFPCVDISGGTPGRLNSVHYEPSGRDMVRLTVEPGVFTPDGDGSDDFVRIRYHLPAPTARLSLRIFDVRGRLVRFLLRGEPSGSEGEIIWDGTDDEGRKSRIGPYVAHLEALSEASRQKFEAKKVVILGGKL